MGEKRNSIIQTYDGVSVDGTIVLKLTVTAEKIEGLMHTSEGYFVIEPLDLKQDLYLVYSMSEIPSDRMKCGASGESFKTINKGGRVLGTAPFPIGTQMRNYRLAAAATGEMTGFYTNQAGALTQITSVINAANLIYELEASIHFTLTSATTGYSIIFTNAATDPFTVDPSFSNAGNSQTGFTAMNTSNLLPYPNYDVGHTFNTLADLGGGSYSISGQAGPTPCQDASKSRGWTQWTLNAALGGIINVFVHEVGHQFSAPHTYNAVGGSSSGSTFCTVGWSSTSAIEPGSGATLMGYANNCTNPNYTLSGSNNLNYFHTKSLEFIYNAVTGSSGTCITQTATGNTPPIANAGVDVIIPKGTPFKLTGTASDANQDAMSYTWEQYDLATANDKGALGSSISGTGGYYAVNSTTAPLFRSQMSSTALDRSFPKLTHILNSANDPAVSEGENLPQVARNMKFRFTVRDNRAGGGGVDSDETIVTVDNSGPFLLTSQNSATLWIYNGTNTTTLTWSVNGTNAAPLNVANVKISFSTDGGTTFPITLLTSTANDGTETITIPNNLTTQGRIKIEPVGTYAFFDINNVNITITNTCNAEVTSITPTTAVSAQAGNIALNLGLSPYGSSITNFTGTIDNTDPQTNMVYSNAGTCSAANTPYYDIVTFKVINSASYTFTKSAGTLGNYVLNLYNGPYSISNPCTNWMNSSGIFSGGSVNLGSSVTATLAPGTYYLVVSGFSSSDFGTYTITPSGGTIYSIAPASGSPYDYTYVTVNNAGNISGFSSTSNLTNSAIYVAGTYTVYGLSYQGGSSLSAYVGTSLSSFQALLSANTVCGKLSSNTKSVTITPCTPPTVAAISGASAVSVGSTIALTNATAGGGWSSSAASSIATISASGVVTGVGVGTTTITYSVTVNGCVGVSTKVITITPPIIANFSPLNAIPGVVVTLTGTGFNTTAANNVVFFGATRATVTAATATTVTVTVPVGATYAPITLLNTSSGLVASSLRNFTPTYSPAKTTLTATDFQAKQDFSAGTTPFSVAMGDLDGDGKSDLVIANAASNTLSVYRNTSNVGSIGAGSFTAKVDFTTGTDPRSVAIGDLDGDGKPDLAVANFGSNTVSVFRNTSTAGSIGAGSFAAKVDFATGNNSYSVAIGDLDGDGQPELAVTNYGSGTVSVLRNTSNVGNIDLVSFDAAVNFASGTNPVSVAISDLDGDSKPDLAVANYTSNTVSVLRNTSNVGSVSSSSFAAAIDFNSGTRPYFVAVGDLDGDGKSDLAVVSQNTATLSVLRNTATSGSIVSGSFAAKVDFTTGTIPRSIAMGDLDGDGKPDLMVANQGPANVSVFRNTSTSGSIGSGSLAPKVDFTTGAGPISVVIGDLDGDGKPDLVVTNSSSNTVSIFRNTDNVVMSMKSGPWNDPTTWNVNRIPLSSESVTIDQNHTVDLTAAVSAKAIVYKNNGKLSFSNASAKLNLGL